MALYIVGALTWAIFVEPLRSNRLFLTRFSVVMPPASEPGVAAQLRANPDVERVVPAVFTFGISLPEVIGGETNWLNLLGLTEADLPYVLQACEATLREGRMLRPRAAEIVLSEQIAANLGLHVGDVIHNRESDLYSNVVDPLELVGILQSDVRLGLVSYEYLSSHELYRVHPTRFLVIARKGREAAVDEWLRTQVQTTRTSVWTRRTLDEQMAREYGQACLLLVPIVLVVAMAISLVVGTVNRIALTRRLPEFGLLHAAGYDKRWLSRRLTVETAVLAAAGWAIGIVLAGLAAYVLKMALLQPRGHDLRVIAWAPPLLVLPIPVFVVGFARVVFRRIFARLDAVAVIEQGELGANENRRRATDTSSPKPLASTTFYGRHKGRAASLIGAMALMIVAVALIVFVFVAMSDAQMTTLGGLRQMSVVSARLGSRLDPAVITQLRAHPDVERVIPTLQHTMLSVLIPPLGSQSINPYAVYAGDLTYLVDLYGLSLREGHLPRPRSNELVIPGTVAQNRGLKLGDVIGDPDHPPYPGAMALPTTFVISGILAQPSTPEADNWLAFISLEFLEAHESYAMARSSLTQLLIVPRAGRKAALDDWLENALAGGDVRVETYSGALEGYRQGTRSQILSIALIETVVAVTAAISLAVLNHIFAAQRQSEYGTLHALGYGRPQLVWRSLRETGLTTGAAWAISVVTCLGGLLYMQFGMLAPMGLRLNLLNVTPWLFTLPIPVAVLAAATGTIARTLYKLDPVSVIERRA